MAKHLLMWIRSPLAALGTPDGSDIPYEVRRRLESIMTYNHCTMAYGAAAYRGGKYSALQWQKVKMFQYDDKGRMLFQCGWLTRIRKTLDTLGYTLSVINNNPPPARPRRYEMDWERVLENFEFRPKQEECLLRLASNERGVVDAVTAFGKSHIIAMYCTLFPYGKIDVITRRKSVARHLHRLLLRSIPDAGLVTSGSKVFGRVTVYTAGSIHHSDLDADHVLVDEVHEMMTDRAYAALSKYGDVRMFGFTATKETRMDNAHERMAGLFGETIFKLEYREAENSGLVVPILVQWLSANFPVNPAAHLKQSVAIRRAAIWRHEARNRAIAAMASELYQQGRQVLVAVETVDHAYHIRKFLPEFAVCHSEAAFSGERGAALRQYLQNAGLLREGEAEEYSGYRRCELQRQFESRELMGVIATGVWSVGVSFDGLEVLVRADGAASETAAVQLPGRVCRVDPQTGKGVGIVIDSLDLFHPRFRRAAASRRRYYAERGWTQLNPDGSLYVPRQPRRRKTR